MLRQKISSVGAGIKGMMPKRLKGRKMPPKGKGLKLSGVLKFTSSAKANLGMQRCYLSLLRSAIPSMVRKGDRDAVGKKLSSLGELADKQYEMLDEINKQTKSSGKDGF
jgi:hypothetical protein